MKTKKLLDKSQKPTVFKKGCSKPKASGRRKGVQNKSTGKIKDAILHAFDKVGGEAYLVTVAISDPKTFCMLLARILPAELNIKAEVEHEFIGLTDTERASRAVAIFNTARKRRTGRTTH